MIVAALEYAAAHVPVGEIVDIVMDWAMGHQNAEALRSSLDAAAIRRAKTAKGIADDLAFGVKP